MASRKVRRDRCESRVAVERLEDRIVLAAAVDLAVVGLVTETGTDYTPFVQELRWAEDRSVTGMAYAPGQTIPDGGTPTTITDIINGPRGGFRLFDSAESFDPGNVLGTRFDTPGDHPLGWVGIADSEAPETGATVAAIIERSPNATGADLAGTWNVQFTQVIGSQVFTRSGTLTLTSAGGFFALAFGSSGDPVFAGQGFEFSGEPDNGRFPVRMANGDTGALYVNADKSVIAFVDLDEADSDTWMGVGVRRGAEFSAEDLAGSYRTGVLFESARLSDISEGDLTVAWQIDLAADGTFEIFDLQEIEDGTVTGPELTGTWVDNGGELTLTDPEIGGEILLTMSDNGRSGIVSGIRFGDLTSPERPMGVFTRVGEPAAATPETSLFSAVLDANGKPLVFDLRQPGDAWSVVDLDRYAVPDPDFPMSEIGESVTDVEAFETADQRLITVVNTDETLLGFARDEEGFWHTRDLTRSLPGAENITSTLTVFTDRGGTAYVAGLTGEGEVVTYEFDPEAPDGTDPWSYANISAEHLTPRDQATPVFVGALMSFVTPWNALNIAGLDAEGNIQAVWTGNGGEEWNASNLSSITGAPPLTSGLTAFVTTWSAINIIGLDGAGNVLATWWVPSFGGNWAVSDLTAVAGGGTPLTGSTLTSFTAPWGALNIAGLTAEGDVAAYWWTPGSNDDETTWQVANLTGSFSVGDPKPDSQLQSRTTAYFGGELNVLGTDSATGELIRLFFRVDDGVWASESVTTIADYV